MSILEKDDKNAELYVANQAKMSGSSSSSIHSSSMDSDSDEGIAPKRIRIIRESNNPFTEYEEVDFKIRFRFRKETVLQILSRLGNIAPAIFRNNSIDSQTQLITLRFYATETF